MATVPVWMLGRGVTAMTAVLQSINATTGVLTPSTSYAMVGLIESFEFRARRITENITPLNKTRANHFPVLDATELTLTEIRRPGQNTCLSEVLWMTADVTAITPIVQFTFTRAGQSWVTYGILTDFSGPFTRTKNTVRLTVRMVDAATAPTYS